MSENNGRVFTESEHAALVDAAVSRETASAREQVTTLESDKSELQTRVDVLETEKAQETQRADAAVQELADFKQSIEDAKALEARKTDRKRQVAEANPLLDFEGEKGEARLARIAAMSEEDFTSYLEDMREVASKSEPKGEEKKTEGSTEVKDAGDAPRATAAFVGNPAGETTGSVLGVIGAKRALQSA